MRPANNQQLFNDDGTPRRKYEIDESPSNKYLLRASIGSGTSAGVSVPKNLSRQTDPQNSTVGSPPFSDSKS